MAQGELLPIWILLCIHPFLSSITHFQDFDGPAVRMWNCDSYLSEISDTFNNSLKSVLFPGIGLKAPLSLNPEGMILKFSKGIKLTSYTKLDSEFQRLGPAIKKLSESMSLVSGESLGV